MCENNNDHFDPMPTVTSAVRWTTPFPDFTKDYYVRKTIHDLATDQIRRLTEAEQ